MNELIMSHNLGVKRALNSMNEVLVFYRDVIANYRPKLDGERYLTDSETASEQSSSGQSDAQGETACP